MRARSTIITLSVTSLLALAGCGGTSDSGGDQPSQAPSVATHATPVTGSGESICLQTSDLGPSYLPLTGSDNKSNSLSNSFDAKAVKASAHASMTGAWLALPKGGAMSGDLTASCAIYIFKPQAVDDIYGWYASTYTSRSQPAPKETAVPAGGPGEAPHVFYSKPSTYSPRASYTYVFKYHNAFVGVRVDGLPGKISVGDAMSLAKVVLGRLQSATA